MTQNQKNYALPIAMMFALFFMISFVTGLQNPMGVIVKDEFGASSFLSQLGNFANFIAYAFMGLPAGLLLKRKGYKFTALAAITVGFLGVVIQFLSGQMGSFAIYLLGAFVAGFSMCMLNTVVNPMLNTLGGGGNKGNRMLQFGGSINSIGATITPVFVGYLIGNAAKPTISSANPALYIAMGIFALAFIVLSTVAIPEPHMEKAVEKKEKDKYSPLSFRHFVLGAIGIFIYVGVEVGIPNISNLFMTGVDNGGLAMDAAIAGSIAGTYWFLMMIGRFVGAAVGAKVSARNMLVVTSLAALVLLLAGMFSPLASTVKMPVFMSDISFGLAPVPVGIMFFILCGLCTSIMWGAIFNLAVEGLGKYVAVASGIFMVMVCGGGILPLIQGAVADLSGSYLTSFFVVVAGFAYLLFYALVGSRNVNKDIPVE